MKSPLLIDCQYVEPQFAAAYLLIEDQKAAFVETNTTHSVPRLLEALDKQGLRPEQVEYVIITHVHLDHAGGASALMKACPNATLLAHPRAATHAIDPSKLVGSARKVYGDAAFEKLYGQIDPIDAQRVKSPQDGEKIPFGKRTLEFIYTRGHANHHFCIFDSESRGVFTGDSFGIAYPAVQKNGLFIFPSTSPTDFDPSEAKASIQKILNLNPDKVYLTHFGTLTEIQKAADQLTVHLNFSEQLLQKAIEKYKVLSDEEILKFCTDEMYQYYEQVMKKQGIPLNSDTWNLLKLDFDLNAAGIAHVAKKRAAAQAESSESKI